MKKQVILTILIIVILIVGFITYQQFFISEKLSINTENKMEIKSVFNNNGRIPFEYTCDGEDISPPLEIIDIPENAKTLAIISDDPDAPMGIWVHWVVWNIPVEDDTKKIDKGKKPGKEGTTDFKTTDYRGPCPPSGTHRYFFKVYALDTELGLIEGSNKEQLEKAMQGHIIEKTELIGLYSRG